MNKKALENLKDCLSSNKKYYSYYERNRCNTTYGAALGSIHLPNNNRKEFLVNTKKDKALINLQVCL